MTEALALADHATLVSLISPALNPELVEKLSRTMNGTDPRAGLFARAAGDA